MIFLSASIPDQEDQNYFHSADITAIRDAVRALATVVLPNEILVFGGHPAITPLIKFVADSMGGNLDDHVTLYQSEFFEANLPTENKYFKNVIFVETQGDQAASLTVLRQRMFTDQQFRAGVFIGGKEGVEDEYALFTEFQPQAETYPVASTGGAAKIIYDNSKIKPNPMLLDDYAYMAMFRSLLNK